MASMLVPNPTARSVVESGRRSAVSLLFLKVVRAISQLVIQDPQVVALGCSLSSSYAYAGLRVIPGATFYRGPGRCCSLSAKDSQR
jgi:hypothetical protein